MLHSTTAVPTVEAVPASGPGALPGFEVRCASCPEVARFAFEGMARDHGADHLRFMLRKEQGTTRRSR